MWHCVSYTLLMAMEIVIAVLDDVDLASPVGLDKDGKCYEWWFC